MIFAVLLSACQESGSPAPVTVADPPLMTQPDKSTATITPAATLDSGLLKPGDRAGSMLLSVGQRDSAERLWEYCESDVAQSGVISRSCAVPTFESIFAGWGVWGKTSSDLDRQWDGSTWQLFVDGFPVNLDEFGVTDYDVPIDGGIKLRLWNLVLEGVTPGVHSLRYIHQTPENKTTDVTWIFSVAASSAYEVPEGAESMLYYGLNAGFKTLAEFNNLLRSAVTDNRVELFWETVIATGQMPLLFGDVYAVFLYRGDVESVAGRGDVSFQYARQGETDIWASLQRFEPDARVEYSILLNGSEQILDPLNPNTEKGGLGTSSVVRMPRYIIPAYSLTRENVDNGTLGETATYSSQTLGYDVNYQVYTPAGYEDLEDLPVIYITDGQDFVNPEMGAMVNTLDNMIADGEIRPIIAVFIDPRDPVTGENRREQELVSDGLYACPFCVFVATELVPMIDGRYRTDTSADHRAILGFSLGGMFSINMGLKYPNMFHMVGSLSPYIRGDWLQTAYQEADPLPLRIFLSHGTYDTGASAPGMRDLLEAGGYPLMYVEINEGHSYGNVRRVLDDLLLYFFGN